MRKKLLALIMVSGLVLSGCSGDAGEKADTKDRGPIETDTVKISQYTGVKVTKVEEPGEITDEDVESAIEQTLQQNASQSEVDREVKEGDTATIDFTGKIDGKEFDGGSSEDYPLTIGSGMFIEGFEDSIIGHKAGDEFDWDGKFPDDYGNADYAGKDVTFTIKVKSVSETVVPELDDEFVGKVSTESKTVEEYHKEVKKQLGDSAQANYNMTLKSEVWQAVMENSEVKEYPDDQVKENKESMIEQYKSMAEQYGMEYEDFIENQAGSTVEEFESQCEEAAKNTVKEVLVVEAIAEKEGITLEGDAYEEMVEYIAQVYGYPDVDTLKGAAPEDELKQVALAFAVQDWLVERCIQEEEAVETPSGDGSVSGTDSVPVDDSEDSGGDAEDGADE